MTTISNETLAKHFPQLSDLKELKTGGQKAVFDVRHQEYGNVVLKIVIHSGVDPRIQREIEIVKSNSFPNVPEIHEVNTVIIDGSTFCYILEQRIEGTDLRSVLGTGRKLPLAQVLRFLECMLATLVRLEEQSIVHRDIKPENILCDSQDNYWLIDFGIARDIKDISLTSTNANFGPHTAGYAAPEQYRNLKRQIDSRADLFSMGVVAFEMLHGFNPFTKDANSIIDVYVKTETVTETSFDIPGDTNNELAGFIQTLMHRNHTFRPPSVELALSWFLEIVSNLNSEAN